jgi:hypothetical protein
MKTKLFFSIGILSLLVFQLQAQNRTQVYPMNTQISDNLDLRAVASIFGDSQNLQDFERRLNDPKFQISNLDLNNDNRVDYLRVVESIENQTHLVVIQAVLGSNLFQDIATIDLERDHYNNVNIQVVGNSNLYGINCIYEPEYYTTPSIFSLFWKSNYRPYYSSWSWNYYPNHFTAWNPYPIYKYRKNISICLNTNNRYNQVNYRSSRRAEFSRNYNNYQRYNYSNRNPYSNNGYESNRDRNFRKNYNQRGQNFDPNRSINTTENEPNKTDSRRETTQNRPIEIIEVQIPRNITQYVDVPERFTPSREIGNQNTNNQTQRSTERENGRRN